MRHAAVLAAFILLTGCTQHLSARGGCPPLINYSADAQRQAAAELRKSKDSRIAQMVVDYGKLRAAIRSVCPE